MSVKPTVAFEPFRDYLLLELIPDGLTPGGIAVPEGSELNMQRALVIKAGPGQVTDTGLVVPPAAREGDIIYLAYGVRMLEIKLGGKDYMIVRSFDMVGRVPKDPEANEVVAAPAAGGGD